MTPDRFAEVERICQAALDREPAARAAYLDEACAGDLELRREVASLLAQEARADRFLERPAVVTASVSLSAARPLLTRGTRLGPYRVERLIGAGGMGRVYEAVDTRLGRTVAIKVLLPAFSADPERRARFEREAKTISAVSHAHICSLFDVGEHNGSTYLVMEHLGGVTLAERLQKGPLPLEQALSIGTEIADALAAVHRQGVIHRDLNPGNVMLTKSGAKLLDFGLAKLKGHGEQPAPAQLATAPAYSTSLSGEGVILGTLPYMAPEQVEGKPADARTDLWALGAILYEMVTGKRAFEGASAASLITAIMVGEPPALATFQPLTPPILDRLVRQCLAKAPEDRPDTAHDVANDLRWARESSGVAAPTGARPRHRLGLRSVLVAVGGVVVGLAAGATVMWSLRPALPAPSIVRSTLPVNPADGLTAGGAYSIWLPTPGGSRTALTWTPDGQALVFVGRRGSVPQLYVRRLEAIEARPLPNTENAHVAAVSPDGQWVAFWSGGAIKKVPFGGGPAEDLAPGIAVPPWGLVWDAHAGLLFGRADGRIWAIPPEGKPAAVTTLGEGELAHTLPWLLPGGRVLLYTVRKQERSWGDERVVAQTLRTGNRKLLLTDATDARYVPETGHVVFLRRGALWAVPFDAGRLELRGREALVLDGVVQALTASGVNDATGAGQFSVSPAGTLAWLSGAVAPHPERRLVTVDRRGQVTALPAPAHSYGLSVHLSPEGGRLAVTVDSLTERGVWVYDLARTTLTPLNRDGESGRPTWTPDGRRVVFRWLTNGRWSLAVQSVDHPSAARVLAPADFYPSSWHPDARTLAGVPWVGGDVLIATVENEKASVQPLRQTPAPVEWPEFSPDGRWLAYGSSASERFEIYVQPYPGQGQVTQVSLDGGSSPAWNPNGRELFYLSLPDPAGTRRMMAVSFSAGSPPSIGRPRPLFDFDPRALSFACSLVRCYHVAPDGERFFLVQTSTPPPPPVVTHVHLIQNWTEELKAKVPVR